MLDDGHKKTIQDAYRAWLQAHGFRARKGQRQMIADVANTVCHDPPRICVIEAGTGTGKTAAYCIALIPLAQASGKKVVISTATVALQEQILFKDLPDLAENTNLSFSFTLAKGRGRYVCLKRLDDRLAFEAKADMPLFEEPSRADLETYDRMMTGFGNGRWNGELDSWEENLDAGVWSSVTTDHRGCTSGKCSFFSQCPFFKARGSVEGADVIVANHDLVLADLNLGGGVLLPAPEDSMYVFDEAHHLPAKTQQHFMVRSRLRGTTQWLEHIGSTIGTMTQRFGRPHELLSASQKLANDTGLIAQLLAELEQIVRELDYARVDEEREIHRFELGRLPSAIIELCEPLVVYFKALTEMLDGCYEQLQEVMDGGRNWQNMAEVEDWLPVVGQLVSRSQQEFNLFRDYADADAGRRMCARWITRVGFDSGDDYELVSAPLDPGEILKSVLWSECHAALCTSATLCALGTFERFLERAGLDADVMQRRIPSPFEFASVATLHVPRMGTDPRNAGAHTDELAELLPALLELEPSALVLFTSWRQLRTVREALPKRLLERCHIQGEGSKQRLIDAHRAAVDQGDPSYIFGLASFAEGVDLPDDYCRHVIICKLPFSVPDDPLEQAYGEWLASMGRNPFFEIAVPDAALKLVQACGRLIRNENDHGRISLLDRRIVTQRYGRAMLESLPPYRLEVE